MHYAGVRKAGWWNWIDMSEITQKCIPLTFPHLRFNRGNVIIHSIETIVKCFILISTIIKKVGTPFCSNKKARTSKTIVFMKVNGPRFVAFQTYFFSIPNGHLIGFRLSSFIDSQWPIMALRGRSTNENVFIMCFVNLNAQSSIRYGWTSTLSIFNGPTPTLPILRSWHVLWEWTILKLCYLHGHLLSLCQRKYTFCLLYKRQISWCWGTLCSICSHITDCQDRKANLHESINHSNTIWQSSYFFESIHCVFHLLCRSRKQDHVVICFFYCSPYFSDKNRDCILSDSKLEACLIISSPPAYIKYAAIEMLVGISARNLLSKSITFPILSMSSSNSWGEMGNNTFQDGDLQNKVCMV